MENPDLVPAIDARADIVPGTTRCPHGCGAVAYLGTGARVRYYHRAGCPAAPTNCTLVNDCILPYRHTQTCRRGCRRCGTSAHLGTTCPRTETIVTPATYTAALTTTPSCLIGDLCDVAVAEDELITVRFHGDGTETPVYGMGTNVQFGPAEVDVRHDAPEAHQAAINAAADLLADAGWTVAGDWEATPTGYTVPVTRA